MAEQNEEINEESTGRISETTENDSKYRKIILAAQRSKQIQRGANPRVDMDPRKTKSTRIAMKELDEGKIEYEILTEK
ncbi:MAG: DNA-directed RNA polymerase subunit omega [Acidobacteriota bacterium]|nr:DNA-directed RNA polymerase subunit omega [Acidobacteriota bacterium]